MEKKSILIFGAGKIGRSFIGQVFGLSGYEVIFSDVDAELVKELNSRKSYHIVIKGEKEEILLIPKVRAIYGLNENVVIKNIANVSIMATSVGKNVLGKLLPVIAKGLIKRYKINPDLPLNIIIAENMRSASEYFREELIKYLPPDYPFDKLVGLVETSIGKMVPIMSHADTEHDPLLVFAEPYNQLIVDRKGFKGEIPQIKDLEPKDNIKAWVDRKAFIHNLGHATSAYFGSFKHPESTYIYEVLLDPEVLDFTKKTMFQSAVILLKLYPNDLTMDDLTAHIENLLHRFQNKSLKDTIFRVGQDIPRKLGPDDRFMGIIRLAIRLDMDYDQILRAMSYAFYFKANDESGERSRQDILFEECMSQGLKFTLQKVCGMNPLRDSDLVKKFIEYYSTLKISKR